MKIYCLCLPAKITKFSRRWPPFGRENSRFTRQKHDHGQKIRSGRKPVRSRKSDCGSSGTKIAASARKRATRNPASPTRIPDTDTPAGADFPVGPCRPGRVPGSFRGARPPRREAGGPPGLCGYSASMRTSFVSGLRTSNSLMFNSVIRAMLSSASRVKNP